MRMTLMAHPATSDKLDVRVRTEHLNTVAEYQVLEIDADGSNVTMFCTPKQLGQIREAIDKWSDERPKQ